MKLGPEDLFMWAFAGLSVVGAATISIWMVTRLIMELSR